MKLPKILSLLHQMIQLNNRECRNNGVYANLNLGHMAH